MTSKLWCGGRRRQCVHSSVPTSHGFCSALVPANTLWKKLITKKSWLAARQKPAKLVQPVERLEVLDVGVLVGVVEPALLARVADDELPAEHQRDEDDRAPEVQLAERLVHVAAEHLGEPEVDRREAPRNDAAAIVRWKWPTTNMVSWR